MTDEPLPTHAQTRVVLVAMVVALVVLLLGVAAVLTHDEPGSGRASTNRSVTTVPPTTRAGPSATSAPSGTLSTLPPTSPSTTRRGLPNTTVTVRAAVGSPEAAANGLILAYQSDDRSLAARFASPAVIDVLFQQLYVPADDPGFQGCRPDASDFLCTYLQPSLRYDMTARGDSAGEFRIVAIDVRDR
ncbi:MAG: hypothetical protein QOH64_2211 [Acidimicrobiaceae bacterium]|jgi:hypothetical protein